MADEGQRVILALHLEICHQTSPGGRYQGDGLISLSSPHQPYNNLYIFNPLPDNKILDRSKLKQSADNNFRFDENSRKFSKRVENTGKRRNRWLRAISPFPTVFSKGLFPRAVKRCHCVGMG